MRVQNKSLISAKHLCVEEKKKKIRNNIFPLLSFFMSMIEVDLFRGELFKWKVADIPHI